MEVILGATDRAEGLFDSLGLMRGMFSPVLRGTFAFVLATLLMKAFQPSIAFEADGSPRPWASLTSEGHPTLMPWWMPGLLFASFVGLFV